jgi:2-polyprenyl-3-methyl-5-hydroxy-6-metoxy-1,4-benzoquinol methylase
VPVYECASCRHQFAKPSEAETHVSDTYGDDYFFGKGAGYENYLEEGDLLIARGEKYASLLAEHTEPGNVLDVGSAAGFLLRGMVNAGWHGMGVEPNLQLSTYARDVLHVESTCNTFEDFHSDSTFDSVSMIQVISHFIDPVRSIAKAAELLRPQGLLLIETWDRSSWTARLLRQHWHEYSPPSVLHWFTKARMTTLLCNNGFEIVASGRPRRWIQIGHAKSLVSHKYGPYAAAALCWLPKELKVPYLGDDLRWILARKITE